jgi:hypothetical protein
MCVVEGFAVGSSRCGSTAWMGVGASGALARSRCPFITHPLTHPPTHPPTHSLTHSNARGGWGWRTGQAGRRGGDDRDGLGGGDDQAEGAATKGYMQARKGLRECPCTNYCKTSTLTTPKVLRRRDMSSRGGRGGRGGGWGGGKREGIHKVFDSTPRPALGIRPA